ncbi:MAG: hypothetical protein K5880_14835 [Hydrogenophaga sp.]|uniref:DUF1281 family ferredoxin-like fold protein n=1 Tax=Hydrogenophaga sp. TaxID=1904254 RepID=UPI00261576D9|nr:hypothetical protein [Hydrogenophaga sp.]MCV0439873.1 hypothetical protein [Hydrogenophaga sp.]
MPNHVTNRLSIEGTRERLDAVKAQVAGDEQPFDLDQIVPMPADTLRGNLSLDDQRRNPNNWYDWSCANWGTKWNCYDVSVDVDDEGLLVYRFDTAWSPPLPVLGKLSAMFPDLHFRVEYFDEGWGFAGSTSLVNGEAVDETELECDTENPEFREMCVTLKGYDPADENEE